MTEPLWTPSQNRINTSLLHSFMQRAKRHHDLDLNTYDDVWTWSIEHPEQFWQDVWDFCDIRASTPSGPVMETSDNLMKAAFFPKARLNFAKNLLRQRSNGEAIVLHTEDGHRQALSWDQLYLQVAKTVQALKELGVGQGDRVAGYLPNIPETVIAMLATTALGAVWSSCSPDFGTQGIIDRFGQIEPKVLFAADGYRYNGKVFDCLNTVVDLLPAIPSINTVIVVPFVNEHPDLNPLGDKALNYQNIPKAARGDEIPFVATGFNDPLLIMFSSGTTGVPKCIVHRAGGVLLQHLKEHQLQCDVQPGDRVFYFTTCGWMMWNWLVSALASEATIVLFDGSPFYPDGNRLASLAADEHITHFGTSAKYVDACAKADIHPIHTHNFQHLRAILSTGSPLSPEGFDYIYDSWKKDCCLASIAGGTDIVGCFVGGNPIGPVYRGESQKRLLGMDVQAFDDDGQAVLNQPGELVCLSPHPSQPKGFWNDPEQTKYHDAYYATYDNVWRHGDLISLNDETGGVTFFGRSDATLNPGGVRIGTAEIYRQVERVNEVLEAVVVGQDWNNNVRVILFVKLRDGIDLNEDLIKRIKSEIRTHTTPRHVPAKVIAVDDIPRTKSGKIVELAVRSVIHGQPVKNQHALANPEALELYKDCPELSG
ncbi:MAG: acetoacetate--CoA ligase [Magnetovibrio sp.]|nr:acetoacetate--CoA ligase [Magnetovibrio sp.]